MSIKRNILIAVISILFITFGLTACSNRQNESISKDLQSQSWTFSDTGGDGGTLRFQKKRMIYLGIGSLSYSVNEKAKTITLKDTDRMAVNKTSKKFKIEKTKTGYIFKPLNEAAKDYGTMTLDEKKK